MAARQFSISKLGVALVVIAAVALLAWPWERAHMQAASILLALENKRVPLLFAGVALHPIERQQLAFQPPGAAPPVRAYLYTAEGIAQPRDIVLVHGVHRLGMDEPRLVTFATALAQSGFRVLTPEIASLKAYHVTPDATGQIAAAVTWMSGRDHERVGLIGFSFAGGLGVLASADAAVSPHVAWVWSIGGHAQMQRVAQYYVTGKSTGADGATFALAPHEYGPLVLVYAHPEDFLSPANQTAILPVLRAHLYEDGAGEKALAQRLSESQLAAWQALLAFSSPQEQQMLAASAAKHTTEFAAVSPENHVGSLTAPLFLLHGAGDNVIPPTELSWLAHDVLPGRIRTTLVSRAISHVSLDKDPGAWEDWKLVHYFATVLHNAEPGPR